MKQKLLNKLWLRVGMIVAIMTTALSGTVWADAVTVSMTSFSEISGNVGGDANISYVAAKGNASTVPAVNSNEIRVYQNGGTFTVTANNGVKINSITLGSSMATTVTYSVDGGTASSDQNISANGTITVGSLNCSSVLFTCTGTTKTSRLYVNSLSVTYTSGGTPTPSISASDVNIAFNADNGSIAYTLSNATGNVTASVTDGNWLTLGTITSSAVPFTCSENPGKTARTATVRLSYTDASDKVVTVTQAGNPNVVDNISDITAAGTYTVRGTIVAKGQRGFIVGDGTGYVYYYNQNYTQSDYSIGDKVKLSGSVVVYGGVFEFNNTATVTTATESNYVAEEPTVLTGSQMDTRVGSTTPAELSTYVQYEGVLTVDGTHYNITSIDGASTAKGSISYPISTDFTSLSGKTVKVTGYYVGISSSTYYNTMLESIEEVVNTDPVISASDVNIAYDATSGEIAYTIANPTGATLTAALTTGDWISNVTVDAVNNKVTFTATANEGNADRTATITLSYTGAQNKVVTVTQGHYVADYATLPFSFNDGKAAIENTAGLTETGLGSDYNSSPKLKFDSTGDELILKINERPGVLTFNIKGNSFSGGTFKVQTSVDGTNYTDLKSYTELDTQSEEFTNLDANVRYIKWVYTSKSSGNVALGKISLAAYTPPVPSITVNPTTVNAPAAETDDALELTYANFTVTDADDFDVQFYDGEGNELQNAPNWVDAEVETDGTNYAVSYIIVANNGAARTAYFKVYAMDDDMNLVYSNLVTITQAAYVAPATGYQYALFSGNLVEGDYIICYDNGAMNTTVSSDRLQYEEVTPVNDVITTDNTDIVWHIAPSGIYWTIYNAEADEYAASTGAKNKAQMLADGTDDKALWTVSGTATYEFVNKQNTTNDVNANLRKNGTYGFACYANTTGGALSLYKKVAESVTVTNAGYATFASTNALDFTGKDIKAYIATANGTEGVNFTQINKVPANTGVLLVGTEGQIVNAEVPRLTGNTDATTGNVFVPGTGAAVASEGTDVKNYVLSSTTTYGVGFYPASDKIVAVGKAYISVPKTTLVKGFIMLPGLDDDATGISLTPALSEGEGEIYNLAGQRLNKMQKGINIVNGKKILK